MLNQDFSVQLISWYNDHKRDLPWRKTKNPYFIWLSEIILQQTRVSQGMPYYNKFTEAFPNVHALANAPEDDVLRLWQGLGYYSRARNLHSAAKYVSASLEGEFPESFKGLKELKGVGDYTAAAIASFAYGEKVAVLDGNVFRVLARVFGIEEDISSPKGKKIFAELAQSLLPDKGSDTYNQAIMEFGALHCKPTNPDCMFCPFSQICYARINGKQKALPLKIKKVKVKKRFIYYLVYDFNKKYIFKKRKTGDVWQGLYDFPTLEFDQPISEKELEEEISQYLSINTVTGLNISEKYRHVLTHQKLEVRFCTFSAPSEKIINEKAKLLGMEVKNLTQIEQLPKPILIHNFLSDTIF